MSWFPRFPSGKRPSPCRSSALAIEALESRLNPSFTFNGGILIIQADVQASSDVVHVASAGAASDGSTGVRVQSNLVNGGTPTIIGDAANPVVRITLDLKDGNDAVSIAGLAKTGIRVGEGNGNNSIRVGDSFDVGVLVGQGQNQMRLGSGPDSPSLHGYAPGFVLLSAGTVVFIGSTYGVDQTTGKLTVPSIIGNNQNNVVVIDGHAGQNSIVDIFGSGNNTVHMGAGNDIVWILGNGNNRIDAEEGNNRIQVDGNGNNRIEAEGTGSITVNGQGNNRIDAGDNPNNAVFLSFAGAGGRNRVRAATGADVSVNGIAATSSGKVDGTHTFVRFESPDDDCDDR